MYEEEDYVTVFTNFVGEELVSFFKALPTTARVLRVNEPAKSFDVQCLKTGLGQRVIVTQLLPPKKSTPEDWKEVVG